MKGERSRWLYFPCATVKDVHGAAVLYDRPLIKRHCIDCLIDYIVLLILQESTTAQGWKSEAAQFHKTNINKLNINAFF